MAQGCIRGVEYSVYVHVVVDLLAAQPEGDNEHMTRPCGVGTRSGCGPTREPFPRFPIAPDLIQTSLVIPSPGNGFSRPSSGQVGEGC